MIENELIRDYMIGIRSDIWGTLHFLSEDKIIYISGNITVICNIVSKKQEFIIRSPMMDEITGIALSPNRRLIAIMERNEEKGIVTLYDSIQLKKRKILHDDKQSSKKIIHISFSNDSKKCIVLGNEPDFYLTVWNIEKKTSDIISSMKLATPAIEKKMLHCADFCPQDTSIICVYGDKYLRLFRIYNNSFRPITMKLKKTEPQNFISHCWFSTGHLVIGTDRGDLIIVKDNEVIYCLPSEKCLPAYTLKFFSKGILVGSDNGLLRIYNWLEYDKKFIALSREFYIQDCSLSTLSAISISPLEDVALCVTSNQQLYSFQLCNFEILKDGNHNNFQPLFMYFHGLSLYSKILRIETCLWKPLLALSSTDRKICIWNYRDKHTVVQKNYTQDILDISLHPCGLQILICFQNSVHLCSIIIDRLQPICEFNGESSCQICCFSNGGQYFALAHDAFVRIYHSYSCEILCHLKGHSSSICSLSWKNDDHLMCTIGEDGVICIWEIPSGKRISRQVDATGSSYRHGTVANNFCSCFVTNSNTKAKMIDLINMKMLAEIEFSYQITQILTAPSSPMLFVGLTTQRRMEGTIRSFQMKENSFRNFKDVQCHSKPVTCMQLSKDQKFLFTASEDGSLSILRQSTYQNINTNSEEFVHYTDEVTVADFFEEALISKTTLKDKSSQKERLRRKMLEINLVNEKDLDLKKKSDDKVISTMNENFNNNLLSRKNKYQENLKIKMDLKEINANELNEVISNHSLKKSRMEEMNKNNLESEKMRSHKLSNEQHEFMEMFKEENKKIDMEHAAYLNEMEMDHIEKIKKGYKLQTIALKRQEDMVSNYQQLFEFVEKDAEHEIQKMNGKFDAMLKSDQEVTKRLQKEHEFVLKEYEDVLKDLDEHKESFIALHRKREEAYQFIDGVKKEIMAKEEVLASKEKLVAEKDLMISYYEEKNQVLKKFKYTLNGKIKNLKKEMEPREEEMTLMLSKAKEKENYRNLCSKRNNDLTIKTGKLRTFKTNVKKEIALLDNKIQEQKQHVLKMQRDMIHVMEQHNYHDNGERRKKDDYHKTKVNLMALFKAYDVLINISTERCNTLCNTSSSSSYYEEVLRQNELLEKNKNKAHLALDKLHSKHSIEKSKLIREYKSLSNDLKELQENQWGTERCIGE